MLNDSPLRHAVPLNFPSRALALCVALGFLLPLPTLAQSTTTPRIVAESAVDVALKDLGVYGTNLVAHGWTLSSDGASAILEHASGDTKYRLTVSFTREPLLIRSEGWVKSPDQTEFLGRSYAMLVEAIPARYLNKAIATTGDIVVGYNNLTTDSYDSADPSYSTGGQYDPNKSKDNGDIATNASLLSSTELRIFGRLDIGPDAAFTPGTIHIIGSKSWHAAGQNGIEPGWFSNTMDAQFSSIQPPFATGMPVSLGVGGNKSVETGDYVEMGNLALSGSQRLTVTGNARLLVKGNISFTGQSHIEIQPGASLQLFVGGASTLLAGNGVVNLTGSPHNFTYYGLKSNVSLSIGPDPDFIGTIYAPHAQLRLYNGGNITREFTGAIVAQSLLLNGHFNFHLDESLARTNYLRGKTTHPPSPPSAPRITAAP